MKVLELYTIFGSSTVPNNQDNSDMKGTGFWRDIGAFWKTKGGHVELVLI